jgi:hypothetical protein
MDLAAAIEGFHLVELLGRAAQGCIRVVKSIEPATQEADYE